jgi:hypothetical protein
MEIKMKEHGDRELRLKDTHTKLMETVQGMESTNLETQKTQDLLVQFSNFSKQKIFCVSSRNSNFDFLCLKFT